MDAGSRQPAGFMFKLGQSFLREYYSAILRAEGTVILCAEKEGKIIGFISGTLRAEERMPSLKRRRFRLAFAALPAFLHHPSLLFQAHMRQNPGSAENGSGFIVQAGPHQEFWAWSAPGVSGALHLQLKWLAIMRTLGVSEVLCEVDRDNELSEKSHMACGAKRVHEMITPDGRERHILRYELAAAPSERNAAADYIRV